MNFSSTTECVLEPGAGPVVIVKFSGYYPPGSAGNDVSGAMRNSVGEAVKKHSPSGVVLDMSDLDYVWGDGILGIFLPLDKGGFKDFIASCVVAEGRTAQAFRSLLDSYHTSLFDMAKSELIENVEEAVEIVRGQLTAARLREDTSG